MNIQNKLSKLFEENQKLNIIIPDSVNDEQKIFINEVIKYIKNYLNIPSFPTIIFTDDRSIAEMTTGSYIPDEDTLYVYIKNRALCDYLKTLAHELTHYKQHIENRIPENLNGRDENLEAEANIEAGNIIYDFAHLDDKNQKIYEL
ncbi:MAG: hypothetical protein ACOC56_06830 [Atribacterota bacterium]